MTGKRLLIVSLQPGHGRVARDLAIARALGKLVPGIRTDWLVAPPAAARIETAGEKALPQARQASDYNTALEQSVVFYRFRFFKYYKLLAAMRQSNIELFRQLVTGSEYNLILCDESYELYEAFAGGRLRPPCPVVLLHGSCGMESDSPNPFVRLAARNYNRRLWIEGYKGIGDGVAHLFAGDSGDIPEASFGGGLPSRRAWALERMMFTGNIVGFDPALYTDISGLRDRLGFGSEPLIVCGAGGSRWGLDVLRLCAETFPMLHRRFPGLRMMLVAGARDPAAAQFDLPESKGLEFQAYFPSAHELFAACDLAVVAGAGAAALELAVLRRPFIYFPLEGHYPPHVCMAGRLERWGAGSRAGLPGTSPQGLAETVGELIFKEARGGPLSADGAATAAKYAATLL